MDRLVYDETSQEQLVWRPLVFDRPRLEDADIDRLTDEERIALVISIVEAESVSTRAAASMIEIKQTISTWPQLASDVALGGASLTVAVRRLALGQTLPSGRRYVDLEAILAAEEPEIAAAHRGYSARVEAFPRPEDHSVVAALAFEQGGGERFVEATVVGTPADDYFDFFPHLPDGGAKISSGSLIFVERAYRMVEQLTFSLMGIGLCWVASRGLTHVVGVANPETERFFLKVGFKRLAPSMYDEKNKLAFVPILLDMNEMSEKFSTFVRCQKSNDLWLPPATSQAEKA